MEEPREWVKSVTWEVAALRADIYMIRALLVEAKAQRSGQTPKEVMDEWEPDLKKMREDSYAEILVRCGLPVDLPDWE